MNEATRRLVHRPAGSGHPYRIDPYQRHPVQPIAGEPVEIRVVSAGDALVDPPRLEFEAGGSTMTVSLAVSTVDGASTTTAGDDHLGAASVAAPQLLDDDGGELIDPVGWRHQLIAPDDGALRYRVVADELTSPWFDVVVGRWSDGDDGRLDVDAAGRGVLDDHFVGTEWLLAGGQPVRCRLTLRIDAGDHVVGFGERFDAVDQRGRRLDTTVFEQYKSQGNRTYLPNPFFIVVPVADAERRSWGLHVDTGRRVWFDVGASETTALTVEVDVDPDDPVVVLRPYGPGSITGDVPDGPAAIVAQHVAATGGLRRPPDWAFLPWMSANNWNTQRRVLEEVERGVELGIPAGVVVIEAWSDETTFCVFRDARHEVRADGAPLTLGDIDHPADGAWPDPVAMVARLADLGVRTMLWQIPLLATDRLADGDGEAAQLAADVTTMVERGWCVAEADGSPYRNRGWWFPGAILPDWTIPEAVDWWIAKRRYLIDEVGIAGFKTDGGEHAWGDELRHRAGRGATENNRYPVRYAAAYHRLLDECGVDGVTFSRAGFTGAGTVPCHWAGDENSTWEAFAASVTAGISAGVSGVAFWGWDLAGFSGPLPSVELYLRATAMAALCPVMQYHSEFDAGDVPVGGDASGLADPRSPDERPRRRDRTPWNVADAHGDERAITVYRRFAVLRQRLQRYLSAEADATVATGLPLMRGLVLRWPGDAAVWDERFAHQYLLGTALLVAPCCSADATSIDVWIPPGDWFDAFAPDDGPIHGPTIVSRPLPWDEAAAYVDASSAQRDELLAAFAGLPDGLDGADEAER